VEEKLLNRKETYLLPVSIRNIWCIFGPSDVAGREQVQEHVSSSKPLFSDMAHWLVNGHTASVGDSKVVTHACIPVDLPLSCFEYVLASYLVFFVLYPRVPFSAV